MEGVTQVTQVTQVTHTRVSVRVCAGYQESVLGMGHSTQLL
jgi:hypothetical protein